MLPFNLGTWTMGQILLVMISILAVLDASITSTTEPIQSTLVVTVKSSTQSPAGNNTSAVTENISDYQSTTISTVPPRSTTHDLRETISIPSRETNQPNRNVTETGTEATSTTIVPGVTDSNPSVLHSGENSTFTKPETPTPTPNVQSPNNATMAQFTSLGTEAISSQTTAVPGSIACLGFGTFTSDLQVACFQYEEETTCETLAKQKKHELRSFLCEIMNTTLCNITIHSSEVQPKCILWVPTSKDAEDRLKNETLTAKNPLRTQIKWGQISDHQTRSQKTMIALVTCGVLLAFFILAGYYLSNRESWSPGRQRLGEDPYCTETDSQGNTLVSVSAHSQDKPNNGTRENGTGQTVLPAATNGHSTKKQTVSDTEL